MSDNSLYNRIIIYLVADIDMPEAYFQPAPPPGLLFNSQEKGRRFYAPKNIVKLDIKGPSASYYSSIQGMAPYPI